MSELKRHEVMIGGTGGQGALSIGYVLADAASRVMKSVTRFPIYLAMQRGGAAYCTVIFSNEEIAAPILSNYENAIAMEIGSYSKFKDGVRKGGHLIVNGSIVKQLNERPEINQYSVPAIELATELGSPGVANMVLLGAYRVITNALDDALVRESIRSVMGGDEPDEKKLKRNIDAYEKGQQYARSQNWGS